MNGVSICQNSGYYPYFSYQYLTKTFPDDIVIIIEIIKRQWRYLEESMAGQKIKKGLLYYEKFTDGSFYRRFARLVCR